MDRWKNNLLKLIDQNEGRIYLLVTPDARLSIRRIRNHSQKYLKLYPSDIYLFHTDPIESGIKMLKDEVLQMNWAMLTRTKDGERISTNVRQPKETNLGEVVATEAIATNAPVQVEIEAWNEALASNPQPTTLKEALEQIVITNNLFKKIIEAKGYLVTIVLLVKQRVRITKIAWINKIKMPYQGRKRPIVPSFG